MLMEDKRLDFDAPLLSVRRFSSPVAASDAGESGRNAGNPRRASLPFYKSELKSGPVRNPGVVPFVWEQNPGQPKAAPRLLGRPPAAPELPPARISNGREPEIAGVTNVRTYKPPTISTVSLEKKAEDKGQKQQQRIEAEPCKEDDDDDDDDDDAFSDAVETLSRTESFFMNCSISGLSGIPDAAEPPSGSFATDPQVRDFMMGRFLPAAQAAAVSSPQCAPRKPGKPVRLVEREESRDYRRPLPLSYHHGPNVVPQYAHGKLEDEGDGYDNEDDEDCDDAGHLSSKACGLIPRFCLKGSICLMNPVPGMKVKSRLIPLSGRRRISSPQIRVLHHGSLGQVEDENSWEAVYKHKLGQGGQDQGEDGSKITSESNHLTYWSDSQTADGSSPYRHSAGSTISPYRNEGCRPPFHEGKGFLGVPKRGGKISGTDGSESCERNGANYLETTPHDDSQRKSESMSPEIKQKLCVDAVHGPEATHSKSSSVASNAETKVLLKPSHEDSEVGVESHRMEGTLVLETSYRDGSQAIVSKLLGTDLPICLERSGHKDIDDDKGFKHNGVNDGQQLWKVEHQVQNDASFFPSLLPPPLPKSPSESWLCRTFPSVSSKNPPQHSFLGIKFQPRKQAHQAASTDLKGKTDGKPVKMHRQLRFADMLTKPLSPESEI